MSSKPSKKAVVMGASSGIGRAVALQLLAQGWQVGVAARRSEALDEIHQQYPEQVTCATIDITSPGAENRLTDLFEEMGGIDLYIHASGIGKQNFNLAPDIELATCTTNVEGFTRMVDATYNYMVQHANACGHIAVISSIAGTKGLGAAPAYSATKAYQNTYLQALEQQSNLQGHSIFFTDIRPGFVDTALLADNHHYPMLMSAETVAKKIVNAIEKKKHIEIIDWRYRLLVALWRRVPRALWRHLPVKSE